MMEMQSYDLAVIGAGPAGISAALTAAGLGLKTLLLDEQPRPGGQIYRNVSAAPSAVATLLGPDYLHGATLTAQLAASAVETRYGALVWDVEPDLTVTGTQGGQAFQFRTAQLIAATGALERSSPLPGWTLPGVMNASAAQIALKASGSIPAGKVVLAGGGPLLLLVAVQLLDAGVEVAALVETSPAQNRWNALRFLPGALGAPGYLLKGLRMVGRLRRAGTPWYRAASELRVEGQERAAALSFVERGARIRIEADLILLHHGVVPNTQLGRLLRVAHRWDEAQLAWRPTLDQWGQSSRPGVWIAGDGALIAGALSAEASGALAALGAARALGRLTDEERERRARPLRAALARQWRIRPFLDALYRPPAWLIDPPDETIVCRCEEVTAGRIRAMTKLGCQGPNQTKFFSRSGMGPCQGRMCGLPVTQILAAALNKTPEQVGAYRIRAPLKPVSLAALAGLAQAADGAEPTPEETT